MPHYPDKRSRYIGVAPWEAGKIENAVPATRESSPGGHFRLTTAEISSEVEPALAVQEFVVPIPLEKDTEL